MKIRNLIFILCCLIFVFQSCGGNANQQQQTSEVDTAEYPLIVFDTTVYNFGKILEGEQVSYKFDFVNAGKKDLVIEKIETSCGCTVPEYDKKPVKPGERGFVRVRFDSSNKEGTVYKTVKVTSNCKDKILELVITGQIDN